MSETTQHVNVEATAEAPGPTRSRTRTCVGCGERVDLLAVPSVGADLIRLILGPEGRIVVALRGGFGRGAHVHARRPCLERAARSGLMRATKGAARRVLWADGGPQESGAAGEPGEAGEALSTDALARAIQSSMDHRIEGLLRAAVRSRCLACGPDAVIAACQRGEGALVLVACDAAAAADLAEVRQAVVQGRAVAWGTQERLGAIVAPAPVPGRLGTISDPSLDGGGRRVPSSEGVGVVSISSRSLAEALRQAVRAADTVTSSAGAAVTSTDGAAAPAGDRRRRGARRARGSSH